MNYIDYLNISTYKSDYGGFELGSPIFWTIIIVSFVFLILGGLLLWWYFSQKSTSEALRKQHEDRSAGSFIGFWARNRSTVLASLAGICIFFGVLFFLGAFFPSQFLGDTAGII